MKPKMENESEFKSIRRVDKWLSNLGYCTRAKVASFAKEVGVYQKLPGGKLLPINDFSIHLHYDEIIVGKQALDHPMGLFLVMNKPLGYVCTHAKNEGKVVYELLPERWRRRSPFVTTVGRLDKDTSGLLLLTDSSKLVHELIHPKKRIKKRYIADFEGKLREDAALDFEKGIELRGEKKVCETAYLEKLDKNRVAVELFEGRYHQVRRMLSAVGVRVTALKRVAFGPFVLEEESSEKAETVKLKAGEWKMVEVNKLLKLLE